MKVSQLRQLIREEVRQVINESIKDKIVKGLEIMLMYAGGIIIGGPILLTQLPEYIKRKQYENNLDKNSTKKEIQKAAEELYDKLKPIERTTLSKYVNTMFNDLDKDRRVFGAENAKKYMDKLVQRYAG